MSDDFPQWQAAKETSSIVSRQYRVPRKKTRYGCLDMLFSSPVVSYSLWSHELQHPGLPLPHHLWSLPKFIFIASVMPPSHLILWHPQSFCLQSFSASGTFPMNRLFTLDDQKTGASASASLRLGNIQGWSPLRLTGLISLLSKVLSGVFSGTSVWRYQLFAVLPSLWSSSHNRTWPLGRPRVLRRSAVSDSFWPHGL